MKVSGNGLALGSQSKTMSWKRTFSIVTVCALAGMAMGGLFGFGAGKLTPEFFKHLIPWQDVEPLGFACFLGATVGVLLGGGLGAFAVAIQFVLELRKPIR